MVPGLAALVQPVVIPAAQVELPEPVATAADESAELPEPGMVDELFAIEEPTTLIELPRALPYLRRISLPGSSRPGLSVVMGLVAVAALFSAGAWWGMQDHGKTAVTKVAAANTATSPHSATARSAPQEVLSLEFSDNLMNPEPARMRRR